MIKPTVACFGVIIFAAVSLFPQTTSAAEPTTAPTQTQPNPLGTADSTTGRYIDSASPLLSPELSEDPLIDPMAQAVAVPPTESISPTTTTEPATSPATTEAQKPGEWLIVPLPNHQATFGWGIVGTLGYITPLNSWDKISPPSTIAGIGYYSENGTWAAALAAKLYLDEDRFRVTAALLHAELNYDFAGVSSDAGSVGQTIPIGQEMTGGIFEALYQVAPQIYLGPRYIVSHMQATIRTSEANLPITIPSSQLDATNSGLGLHGQWDTRDSQFYPHKGFLLDADMSFHDPSIGDSFDYQVYQIAYNRYMSLSPRQVLAYRVMGQFENGDVPFYGLSTFGRGPDLRGYKIGQHQDKQMFAAQAEYRLEITKRFGAVAFFGVGEVAPSVSDFNFDNLLPAGGVGLRFVVAPQNHVAIRLDGAWGRDGGTFYLAVGEAF